MAPEAPDGSRAPADGQWIEDPVDGWIPAGDGDWTEPLARRRLRRVLWAVLAVIVLLVATVVPYRRVVSDHPPSPDPSPGTSVTLIDT